MIRLFITFVDT